jgi:hypothetical protein
MMAKKRSVRVEGTENKARAEIRRFLLSAEIRRLLLGTIHKSKWTPLPSASNMSDPGASDMDVINRMFGALNESLKEQSAPPLYHDNELYRAIVADVLERNVPPSPWRDYILFILRNSRPVMPSGMKHFWRNWTINTAVEYGREAGLAPTRGRHQRYTSGAHSACSLVADELKEVGLHISEDGVEKIWRSSEK